MFTRRLGGTHFFRSAHSGSGGRPPARRSPPAPWRPSRKQAQNRHFSAQPMDSMRRNSRENHSEQTERRVARLPQGTQDCLDNQLTPPWQGKQPKTKPPDLGVLEEGSGSEMGCLEMRGGAQNVLCASFEPASKKVAPNKDTPIKKHKRTIAQQRWAKRKRQGFDGHSKAQNCRAKGKRRG